MHDLLLSDMTTIQIFTHNKNFMIYHRKNEHHSIHSSESVSEDIEWLQTLSVGMARLDSLTNFCRNVS